MLLCGKTLTGADDGSASFEKERKQAEKKSNKKKPLPPNQTNAEFQNPLVDSGMNSEDPGGLAASMVTADEELDGEPEPGRKKGTKGKTGRKRKR